MTSPPTIALVYNDDLYLHRFRGGLLRALMARGYRVHAIAPAGEAAQAFEDSGIPFTHWPLARRSVNPLTELRSVVSLWRIYRRLQPDLVQHFTTKPNVYGAIAARLAGVPTATASVNGLGYVFTGRDARSRLIRPLVSLLYRLAFGMSEAVVFQNRDDIQELERRHLLSTGKSRYIPGGSGVDTSVYSPEAVGPTAAAGLKDCLGIDQATPVVLLVGRMLWHKGIAEYVECARLIKEKRNACFLLVGPLDKGNPASISSGQLARWVEEGGIKYLGPRSDVRELLAIADVVALPSYREGLPRVLLEASAMGRPMVATDVPGCREVVEHEVNGLLVRPEDSVSLAQAVEVLLGSDDLRRKMGAAAREKAVQEFDEGKVIERMLELYRGLLSSRKTA